MSALRPYNPAMLIRPPVPPAAPTAALPAAAPLAAAAAAVVRAGVRPSVDLRIDELVLHGFAPADRWRVGAAVERELSRLLAEDGLRAGVAGGYTSAAVDAGSFPVRPGARPDGIGEQAARSVHASLNRAGRTGPGGEGGPTR